MDFITKRFLILAAVIEAVLASVVSYSQLAASKSLATGTNIGSITFEQAVAREVLMEWVFINEPIIGVTFTVVLLLLPSVVIAKAALFGFDHLQEEGLPSMTR